MGFVPLALAVAVACGSSQEDRMPQPSSSETATNNELAAEALAFGGIVLPPAAKVVVVNATKGIDLLYTLTIEIEPAAVNRLLAGSAFTVSPQAGRKVFMEPNSGFTPNDGTDIASAQDRLPPDGERTNTVTREILIDRSDPTKTVIHIWVFTT